MPNQNFPARLHVLLAREAPVGLVIRRGPAKSVCTVLWDLKSDTYKLGQWLKGRIYERRCDLSPDGQFFIYFAMNGRWNSETKGSWTAISRAPYLKAIALFAKGDCWHGGGLFLSKREFWLNGGNGHTELQSHSAVRRIPDYQPAGYYGGECRNVYYNRLQRDGWILLKMESGGAAIFEKALPGSWVLRKHAHAELGAPPGRGCYWDAHELRHEPTGAVLAFPEWEWADWDGQRLVWAANGQLWTAWLKTSGLFEEKTLQDFNSMKFEAVAVPY